VPYVKRKKIMDFRGHRLDFETLAAFSNFVCLIKEQLRAVIGLRDRIEFILKEIALLPLCSILAFA
jgi:hypothetical protein